MDAMAASRSAKPPVRAKGPPPPVPKKPTYLHKDLPIPPKPTDKLNISLRDELNRKLATHLTLPTPNKDYSRNLTLPKIPTTSSEIKSSNLTYGLNQNQVKIKDELQNILAKRNESSYKDDKVASCHQQSTLDSFSTAKLDIGSSLTHVTKLVETPKEISDLDNTLDLSLTDNPFDATQSHGDELSARGNVSINCNNIIDDDDDDDDDDNTDDFLDDLTMIPPPPDMTMFDDSSEANEEIGNDEQGSISSSNEVYDVNVFIPPPPPEPLLYDSDEESYSDCNFGQIPDFVDSDGDNSINIDNTLEQDGKINVLGNFDQIPDFVDSDGDNSINIDSTLEQDGKINVLGNFDQIPDFVDSDGDNSINIDNTLEQDGKIGVLGNFDRIPDFVDSDGDNSINIDNTFEEDGKIDVLGNENYLNSVVNQETSLDNIEAIVPVSNIEPIVPVNKLDESLKNINHQSNPASKMTSTLENKRKIFESENMKSEVNFTSKNTMPTTHIPTSSSDNAFATVLNTPPKSPSKSPTITPSITPSLGVVRTNPGLANNINHILKRQLSNPGTPIKISDYKKSIQYDSDNNKGQVVTSGRSTPGLELDSGFSTAWSQDGSVSDKNHSKNNKLEETLFTALPAADNNKSSPDTKSPLLSRVSRTFSSSSESSTFSDEEPPAPKINLRNMLLQHMKNNESDSDLSDENDNKEEKKSGMDDADVNNHFGADTETRLNEVDVIDWRVEDVCEWLELIGFSYLRSAFAKKMVTGKILISPNLRILDQIRFESPEDREIIQSEISALQMTNDEEMEMAILDALDKAYTVERDEIMSTMNGGTHHQVDENASKRSKLVMKTPNVTLDETNSRDVSADYQMDDTNSLNSKEDLRKKLGADVYDPDDDDAGKGNEMTDSNEQLKVKKKSKKKGFFSSLRKKGKREQSAIADEQMQSIVQSNPKGMVSIGYLPTNGGNEMEIKLLISMNTTSREVCNLCLDYLGLNEDLRCFYLVVSRKNKKGQTMDLTPSDPPLMFQCKWSDDVKHRFELKHKYDGHIVVNSENIEQQEMVTCKLGISSQSTAKDIIPILLKVFKEKEERKYFSIVQGDKDNRITDNCTLLGLPLNGQKNHIFKLVNSSPNYLNQRKISYNEAKKVDTKVNLLEKQVDKLSTLTEEYRRSEEHLTKENDKLNMEVKKHEEEALLKNNDVKILQDQITTLTQKLRFAASPLNDGLLKEENEKQKQKIIEQQYSLKTLEQSMKSLKEGKTNVERELEDTQNKCQKLENSNEELKEQLEQMRAEKRNKTTDNTEQMNKLYSENKEYLKSMRALEDKLSDAEQRLAEFQIGQDVASHEELAELRSRIDSQDSALLAKDTRILEFEYKMQQKDRDVKDMRDQWEDECRKSRKETEMRENAESKYEDLSIKLDNLRLQMNEKESQLQNFKSQNTKLEKKLNKQKYILENERNVKAQETHEINKRHQEELNVLLEKVQNADKMLAENDLSIKELAFDLTKEKEDLTQANADLEKKLAAKDILLDRLESKIAKADLNLSSKLQEQEELLRTKEEKIQRVELEIARLENEHASKLREMSNAIRAKESVISKMESRFRKLEMSSGDNVKKFEKYVSEKDRLMEQVTIDHEKTMKDLKFRVRELEETLSEKDKKLREAMRQYGEIKTSTDARLKKREKEYKRQKFLLEKVLKLVSDKAPSLLRQLHESLDVDNASLENMKTSGTSPREGVIHDEWC